jgi:hypothetical protein
MTEGRLSRRRRAESVEQERAGARPGTRPDQGPRGRLERLVPEGFALPGLADEVAGTAVREAAAHGGICPKDSRPWAWPGGAAVCGPRGRGAWRLFRGPRGCGARLSGCFRHQSPGTGGQERLYGKDAARRMVQAAGLASGAAAQAGRARPGGRPGRFRGRGERLRARLPGGPAAARGAAAYFGAGPTLGRGRPGTGCLEAPLTRGGGKEDHERRQEAPGPG